MNKPKEVSVSFFPLPNGELKIWCASFTIKGERPKDEASYHKKCREIEKILEQLTLPEE